MPTQIEFVAQPGYSFTVALRNPNAGYTSLATGLTVTQVTPGVYRCSTGSVTGVVYVEANAGALRVVGYANLDTPNDNGYSEVLDTLVEASSSVATAIEELAATVSGLSQTGKVEIVSPVNEDGSINPLVIGDTYTATEGRAIDLFIDPISGVNAVDCQCTFGGEAAHKGKWLVSGAVSAVTVDSVPKWRMRFELASNDTRNCLPGCYGWGATLIPPSKRVTRITGTVELVLSHTL